MSMGDANAKFPNQSSDAIPPSPSRENPGAVYPKSDPKAAPPESVPGTGGEREPSSVMGNPFAYGSALNKLDIALNEVISTLEGEISKMGSAANEQKVLQKFQVWRNELQYLKNGGQAGHSREAGNPQEGPLFTD